MLQMLHFDLTKWKKKKKIAQALNYGFSYLKCVGYHWVEEEEKNEKKKKKKKCVPFQAYYIKLCM